MPLSTLGLVPGQTFVLFSDGVPEAMDPQENFYDHDRLLATLHGSANTTPRDIVARVLADVHAFRGGAKQSDDITVLAVRYSPLT